MTILGIETSCDESSVALLSENGQLLFHEVSSQVEVHRPFHGVVPEIAARHHLINLPVLMDRFFKTIDDIHDISLIAVTHGPGLVGSLLVGVSFAKSLSVSTGIPLIGINHIEGHLFSPFINRSIPDSFLGMVISGSHASIYHVRKNRVEKLNGTRDDAPGEAFDKVAKLFSLPYPGGPVIDRLSDNGNPDAYPFKLPRMSDGSMDFSFSGVKSAVSRMFYDRPFLDNNGNVLEDGIDLIASFQEAIIDQLLDRINYFWGRVREPDVAVSGGVAANTRLSRRLKDWARERDLNLHLPEKDFITDNAAMIAFRAGMIQDRCTGDDVLLDVQPRMGQGR